MASKWKACEECWNDAPREEVSLLHCDWCSWHSGSSVADLLQKETPLVEPNNLRFPALCVLLWVIVVGIAAVWAVASCLV